MTLPLFSGRFASSMAPWRAAPEEIPTEIPTETPTEVPTEIPTEIPGEVSELFDCGMEAHLHNENCYDPEGNLVFAITYDDELVYWIHMGSNFNESNDGAVNLSEPMPE